MYKRFVHKSVLCVCVCECVDTHDVIVVICPALAMTSLFYLRCVVYLFICFNSCLKRIILISAVLCCCSC